MRKIIVLILFVLLLIIPVLAMDSANKIVYEKDGIIYLVNSDGTNEKRLSEGYYPIWSPDGNKILFFSKEITSITPSGTHEFITLPYSWNVYTINVDGSGKTTVLKDIAIRGAAGDEPGISYSPDGKIVFAYERICKDEECETLGTVTEDNTKTPTDVDWKKYFMGTTGHIGMINDDGTGFVHLTNTAEIAYVTGDKYDKGACTADYRALPKEILYCHGSEYSPIFSPDGKKFVYRGADGSIKIKNSDGSNPVTIITKGEYPDLSGTLHLVGWSPDGNSLLISNYAGGYTTYIYRVQSDGSGLMKLSEGGLPKWSPDGKMIAYYANGLWTMNGDGTNQKEIYKSSGKTFDWSPDSQTIVTSGMTIVNLTGGVKRICDAGGNDPKWSPVKSFSAGQSSIFGNAKQSSDGSGQSSGNSKQTPGFGGIIAVCGFLVSMAIFSLYCRKNN